jgi:hypothetical protein
MNQWLIKVKLLSLVNDVEDLPGQKSVRVQPAKREMQTLRKLSV